MVRCTAASPELYQNVNHIILPIRKWTVHKEESKVLSLCYTLLKPRDKMDCRKQQFLIPAVFGTTEVKDRC